MPWRDLLCKSLGLCDVSFYYQAGKYYILLLNISIIIFTIITIAIINENTFLLLLTLFFFVGCVQLPARGIGSVGHYKA